MKWLLIALFSLPCSADWQDWNKTDKLLFKSKIVLDIIDIGQTYDVITCQNTQEYCRYYEVNPLFGSTPDIEDIIAAKIAGNFFIYKILDKIPAARRKGLIVSNIIEFAVVYNNHNIGLNFKINL
jgi:hypothetical protein